LLAACFRLQGTSNHATFSAVPDEDKSRLRQQIHSLEEQRDQQLEVVLDERGPMLRGTVAERARVCGNPGCRCASKGELHVSPYLSVAQEGASRRLHLPADDVQRVQQGTERYRRFRQARARLVQLAAEQIQLVDRLSNALLGPYPPDAPVTPPGRRGPRRKRSSDGTR
jgi:hypothetical protein